MNTTTTTTTTLNTNALIHIDALAPIVVDIAPHTGSLFIMETNRLIEQIKYKYMKYMKYMKYKYMKIMY